MREVRPGVVEPADAASVLLLRDGENGLEVLVVVRARALAFMGGRSAFPGGRVDPADRDPALRARASAGTLTDDAVALRAAAIRETFEETGVLLARARGDRELVPATAMAGIGARWRGPLLAGSARLLDLVVAEDLDLACDVLTPSAHWITPEASLRRFDTRFFVAASPGQPATLAGDESEALAWIEPRRLLADEVAGARTLALATRLQATCRDAAAAIDQAGTTPVVPVLPWYEGEGAERRVRIRADAGYDPPAG